MKSLDHTIAAVQACAPTPTRNLAALQLYRWMFAARSVDKLEHELVARGEAAFHVACSGHEATAALALHMRPGDYLHAHYRDKALMLALGLPVREFFDSLLCTADSHSGGRQMSAHLSAPHLGILSTVGPVGNHALQAVGVAQALVDQGGDSIVVCSMGDGTTQQGEVMESIAEAVRSRLPVLFLVQDNHYAISTTTQAQTFFSLPQGDAGTFYGLPIHRVDGASPAACTAAFDNLVQTLRRGQGPVLCVMAVERLSDHTNADDETIYRDEAERRLARTTRDPLTNARVELGELGITGDELQHLQLVIENEVRAAAEQALNAPPPLPDAQAAIPSPLAKPRMPLATAAPSTMAQALRDTLRERLGADPRVTLYGQDIEDPKGDVFGVTRGLSTAFPGRVRNAPLSESTIVGTSIGRALAGGRPVAFVQFADFLPLAFNQIASELATMAWRTRDGWRAPVVVLASCGAYRPGLGPFHAQTYDALLAHLPGIDVLMPSTPADAAAMLHAALTSERPSVLLVPKALLHAPMAQPLQAAGHPAHGARQCRAGKDVTLVAWGNTVGLCERAADALAAAGATADVIDLRWLAPWDADAVVASVRRTRRLLVVHEDNRTGGFGAEVVAHVVENVPGPLACRRVARSDTHVPCHPALQQAALPSYRNVLEAAAQMLELHVDWTQPDAVPAGLEVVPVIGGSPADQTVLLADVQVVPGQAVVAGQWLASVEADKAVFDIASPAAGIVQAVHLAPGMRVGVGTPLLTLAVETSRQRRSAAAEPVAMVRRAASTRRVSALRSSASAVVLQSVAAVCGSGRLDNHALARLLTPQEDADVSAAALLRTTGIQSRPVAAAGEDAVSLALAAAHRALASAGFDPSRLTALICSTSTPTMVAPSTACQVLHRLAPQLDVPAYDVQAACSGYLYAIGQAWDLLQQQPQGCVLVITTETMRRIVDAQDLSTSPIFADAASATLIARADGPGPQLARLHRPVLGARGDDGSALRVPIHGFVHMDGRRVFTQAVRTLGDAMLRACEASGWSLNELDLVVPHQANGRIIEAVGSRLGLPADKLWNEVRHRGNTSSSSIPLALSTVLNQPGARRIGLCAFGAGYTHGAAVLER